MRLQIELPRRIVPWHLYIGDNIADANLSDLSIEISVKNHSGCIMDVNGTSVANSDLITVYKGTLGEFWAKLFSLGFYNEDASCDLKFSLDFNFVGNENKLPRPLKIIAIRADSM